MKYKFLNRVDYLIIEGYKFIGGKLYDADEPPKDFKELIRKKNGNKVKTADIFTIWEKLLELYFRRGYFKQIDDEDYELYTQKEHQSQEVEALKKELSKAIKETKAKESSDKEDKKSDSKSEKKSKK